MKLWTGYVQSTDGPGQWGLRAENQNGTPIAVFQSETAVTLFRCILNWEVTPDADRG